MEIVKRAFYAAVCVILLGQARSFAQTEHTVAGTVEVSATAINEYLQTEYDALKIPQQVTVPYNGINYTLVLTLPKIILTTGNIEFQMIFDLNQGNTNLYHFEVDPSVDIPAGQVSSSQVQGFLADLPTKIDNISGVPTWVKSAVVQYYNSLALTIYPSKLTDYLDDSFLAQRRINVDSLALGWQVGQGVLDLVVTTYLNCYVPKLWVRLFEPTTGDDYAYFLSNIQDTVSEVEILPNGGSTLTYQVFPHIICPKGGTTSVLLGSGKLTPGATFIVNAVYMIENTWYCGQYAVVVNSTDASGQLVFFGPTKSENF